jgi:hypothetical protein
MNISVYMPLFNLTVLPYISLQLHSPILGFDSRRGLGIFLFTTASRTVLEPTHPPTQWVPGALSQEVERPGREDDLSPPSSAEDKNAWSYTSTPPIRLHGVVLR